MNKTLEQFARNQLKEGMAKLPEGHQHTFKLMYANGDLSMDINTVIDKMPAEKLDWAMEQVERSIKKIGGVE
jgi:hypothetical protein